MALQVEFVDQERQAPGITKAVFVDPETADVQESFARGYVSPRVCLPEIQETVEVAVAESADQVRQVPVFSQAQTTVEIPQDVFVGLETVCERGSFARGSLCPRVCLPLDSALGPAECKPESWQECWQWRAVPQGLFVQLSAGVGGLAFELQLAKEGAGVFFRRYGKTHIGEDVGGSRALVTFEHAHQARAAQQCCDHLPMASMPGARLRVQFLGLVSWPGTNRLHRSSGSFGSVRWRFCGAFIAANNFGSRFAGWFLAGPCGFGLQ